MALTGGKTTMSESVGEGGLEELGGMVNPAAMGGELSRSWPFWKRFTSGIEMDRSFRGNDGFVSGKSERGRGVSGAAPTQGTTFVTTRERKDGRDLEGPEAIFKTEWAVNDDEVPVKAGALRR